VIKHKFRTGDRVRVLPDPANANGPTGLYTILKLLPVAGRGCQYRAKGVTDTYERVLDESLLRAAD
jgi:hypothetical protein